jgi:hypothetical protein
MKLTTKKLKQLVRETLAEAIHAEVAQKLSEKKGWVRKADAGIEKKGSEGEFTKYCKSEAGGGYSGVTQGCVDHAAEHGSTERKQQAAFAANVRDDDPLKYPKGSAKKKKKKKKKD